MFKYSRLQSYIGLEINKKSFTFYSNLATDGNKLYLQDFGFSSITIPSVNNSHLIGTSLVAPGEDSVCYVIPEIDATNADTKKRECGVYGDQLYSDFIKLDSTGLLLAVYQDSADQLLELATNKYQNITSIINQREFISIFAFNRIYKPSLNSRHALIDFSEEFISVTFLCGSTPMFIERVEVNSDKEKMFKSISNMLINGTSTYGELDRIILLSSCDVNDAKGLSRFLQTVFFNSTQLNNTLSESCKGYDISSQLEDVNRRSVSSNVELFDILKDGVIDISNLPAQKQADFVRDGHKYVISIYAAEMLIERVGCKLSGEDLQLNNQVPSEIMFYKDDHWSEKILALSMTVKEGIKPVLNEQKYTILLGIIVAICLIGYQFYSYNNLEDRINSNFVNERAREKSLVDIREKHDALNQRLIAIKDREQQIKSIRSQQELVHTIVSEIDSHAPQGLQLNDLSIQGTAISLSGKSIDKVAFFNFTNQLDLAKNSFTNVVPVYDSQGFEGQYHVTCTFIGKISDNNFPVQSQLIANKNK